ncbi:hypothetical protein DRQ50_08045 [bacterium]|nr:MAG: hypothetical protein DRQ50_08045 [bacterium]
MKTSTVSTILALVMALLALAPGVRADWVLDGNLVDDPALLNPWDPQVVTGPDGGVIIVYVAHETGYHDIYAQRYDAWGNALWGAGVPVAVEANEQYAPVAVSDGTGGVIVAWTDFRSGVTEGIYAQRLDSGGNTLWFPNGVNLVAGTGSGPHITTDHAGGAIVAWPDNRGADIDLYAQRLDPEGNELWTVGGFGVCTTTGDQQDFVMAANGMGGAYFVWSINTGAGNNILGQHVNAGGWLEWHTYPHGRTICNATGDQWSPAVIPDDHGRIIVTWLDNRSMNSDVYAQLVDGNGSSEWLGNGLAVNTNPGGTYDPALASDGAGGAIFVWDQGDVYAQRVDMGGNVLWAAAGVPVCTATASQNVPRIVPDGVGGAVVAWEDNRFSNYDVYAQRVGATGTVMWPTDGAPVCTALGDQRLPVLASDGNGGGFLAWTDPRLGNGTSDIYIQRIERNGYWGYPSPVIAAVDDIPGDEGWQVNVSWGASRLDPWPDEQIETYSLWRALDGAAAKSLPSAATLVDLDDFEPGLKGKVIRKGEVQGKSLYWEYLGDLEARHLSRYAQALSTLFNLTPESQGYHAFQVVAHGFVMGHAGYWISEPDTGRSIDNLAPEMPAMVAGEQIYDPVRLEITWDPNTEQDLSHYLVYRGTAPNFVPVPTNLVASPTESVVHDDLWQMGSSYYYKVAARDVHGNESPYALLSPVSISAVDLENTPSVTALTGIHPNPFNPRASIRFTVHEPQRVTVAVYDLAGRRVAVLTDEVWQTGSHDLVWEGRNAAGREMASGVYLVDFRAGNVANTTKVMLVR